MSKRKRVGVIGAGAAGLCAARRSLSAGHDVLVIEQQHDVGGVWLYSPHADAFSALYDNMRFVFCALICILEAEFSLFFSTNLPKAVMGFLDEPFETIEQRSFVPHADVQAYLRRYSESIRSHIQAGRTFTHHKSLHLDGHICRIEFKF